MKSSGQTRLPTPIRSFSEPTEPIARTRSQPRSSSAPQVRRVVEPVGRHVGVGCRGAGTTMAPCRSAAAATSSADPGPMRVAAEHHRQASHRADPTRAAAARSPIVGGWRTGRRAERRPRTSASTATSASCCRSCGSRCPGCRSSSPSCSRSRSSRTSTTISPFEKRVYFATLLCTAISAALLIAPSAYHRLTFHYQQKGRLVFIANRLTIAGLGFLALAMTGALMLITDVLYGGAATVVVAAGAAAMFAGLWCVLPLRRRVSLEREGAERRAPATGPRADRRAGPPGR